MLTQTEIHLRIDELSAIGRARMLECNPGVAGVIGGAEIDFLTPSERTELHQLKLQLPIFAELRSAAKKRIAERIAQRHAIRLVRETLQTHSSTAAAV